MKLPRNEKTGHFECPRCKSDLHRAMGKGKHRDPDTNEIEDIPIWFCGRCKTGIPEEDVDE